MALGPSGKSLSTRATNFAYILECDIEKICSQYDEKLFRLRLEGGGVDSAIATLGMRKPVKAVHGNTHCIWA